MAHKVFPGIIIAWYGNSLFYSFFEQNDNNNEQNFQINDFEPFNVSFNDLTEITRVLDTKYPNVYQIIL